jgi:glycine dehydrogenase
MVAIRTEVADIEAGRISVEESPLRHAPHTTRHLAGEWDHRYDRSTGAFPAGYSADKYWPPVSRIDQAYGDRHLVCSCPDPTAFEDEGRAAASEAPKSPR